jgi:hypothetical protein
MTLEEFIEHFKVTKEELFSFLLVLKFQKEYRLVPIMLSSGLSVLYTPRMMQQPSRANDMKRK